MYKFGLVSVSFRNNTPEEIVKSVKDSGLSAIEWGSDIHAPYTDIKNLEYIKNLCDKNGIEISSYGTYFTLGKDSLTEFPEYINAAKILGTDVLRLWCGDKSYSDYSDEEFDAFCKICKEAALIAEKSNVKLCMECHNGTVTDCLKGALSLMKSVNSKSFRMYWQPNQFISEEENMEYAKGIAEYTEYLHVFNWKGNEKYPLIDGREIWKKYLSFFDKNRTLLLEFMPDGKIESLKNETDSLLKIAGEMTK